MSRASRPSVRRQVSDTRRLDLEVDPVCKSLIAKRNGCESADRGWSPDGQSVAI